jgi:hypothetical protein
MRTCRNSGDGQHETGPPSAAGNFFCRHCGRPMRRRPAVSKKYVYFEILLWFLLLIFLFIVMTELFVWSFKEV